MKLRINIIYKKITTLSLLLFVASGSVFADDAVTCELSAYGEEQQKVIVPEDVTDMAWEPERQPEGAWRFELTEEAGKRLSKYTSSRVGQSLELFCGEKKISHITIMAPLHSSFILTGLDKNLVPFYDVFPH